MRLSRKAVVGGLAAAVLMAGGAAYAGTLSTPTAGRADTIVTTTASKIVFDSGGAYATIMTLGLAPGDYVVHVSGVFKFFGSPISITCQISFFGKPRAVLTDLVGASRIVGGPAATELSPFSMTGGVINATGVTENVTLLCTSTNTDVGFIPDVEAGASLWAHKTGYLKLVSE